MLRNIPAHDCRNCGACCGPTMASENEIELIKKYIAGMDKVYRKKLKGQKKGILDCPYYYPFPGQCPDRRSDFESVEGGFGL